MVVTIEPGIYLPDLGGVRIEDDVLVTKTGHELLTSAAKQWEDTLVDGEPTAAGSDRRSDNGTRACRWSLEEPP